MKLRSILAVAALLPLFACSGGSGSGVIPTSVQTAQNGGGLHTQNGAMALPGGGTPVCTGGVVPGQVQCPVLINTVVGIVTNLVAVLTGRIPGYHPEDLRSAYNLPSTGGVGSTVAVIDMGDDPNAESDLGVYRKTFGLPPCTTANGCFRKLNGETGKATALPPPNQEWAAEEALDIEMVSAICPNCHIILMETQTPSVIDFGNAIKNAVADGATEISNSYYTTEDDGAIPGTDAAFDHPGIPITAAAGDTGYAGGVMFPASSQYVTAVGGTTLVRAPGTARGWSETAWSGTTSGCSSVFAKPAWQTDSGCSKRTVADVAVVADPSTGVSVYNTYASLPLQGWGEYGGTSVGAPVIAAIYALAGNGASINDASYIYAHASSLNAVTVGSDGSCTPFYLCTAGAGYNGPAGLGTPNGTGAF